MPSTSLSPSASASGLPAACTTVATGLINPRGISITADGTIYVAEAGTGGTEPDFPSEPGGSPGASPGASGSPVASGSPAASGTPTSSGSPQPVGMHGDTGQVTMITPDGQQSVFATGLTSYSFLGETIGPAGVVAADDGTIYVSVGGPGPGLVQFVPAGTAGWVVSIDASGTVTPLANLAQYERDNNPDPNQVDSNLGGMAMGTDGLLYVADSGGNDLLSVDPTTGEINVVAVFPGLPSPDGAPNPERGDAPEVDPVPTSVFADPQGGVYVGFLTGAALWGTPGAAKVVHVAEDGTVEDVVTGTTMVTGVAASNGTVYASELSTSFVAAPPAPGQLVVAQDGGAPNPQITGLPFPYGLALAADGQSIYIVINSTGSTDATSATGEVVNCELPTPAGTPSGSPAASASPTAGASASPGASAPATTEPSPSVSTSPDSSPSSSP